MSVEDLNSSTTGPSINSENLSAATAASLDHKPTLSDIKTETYQHVPRTGSVLVFGFFGEILDSVCKSVRSISTDISVLAVDSISEFRRMLTSSFFDVVIIDTRIASDESFQLVHECNLLEYDPAILMLSDSNNPAAAAQLLHAGCQRYIVTSDSWVEELAPAIRHSLRMKRLEEENRILVERLTEANKQLEEKNKRLDDFNATVAHDIRGVLSGVTMRLDYVLETEGDKLDQKIKTVLEKALSAGERVTDIVQATYQFAQLGAKAIKKSEIDLEILVTEAIADCSFDESLDINIGLDKLPKVWGNKALLSRVFINLLTNAVKYNDKDMILINVGLQQYVSKAGIRYAEVFVEDNGSGIEDVNAQDAFQMFWQASSGKQVDGLGIGLAVVKRIAELHSGEVRIEKSQLSGAKIVLTLPIDEIGSF